MALIVFAHFMVATTQVRPMEKPVAPFAQQLLQKLEVPREIACGGNIYVREALHCV